MSMLVGMRRVAVIAPHPDDEVLGCGGTMARLASLGAEVQVVVMTRGTAPRFADAQVAQVQEEARKAHALLGVGHTHFLNLPAAELDVVRQADVNAELSPALDAFAPDTLLVPFVGDIHRDHQVAFMAALVWARPRHAEAPLKIWAYETVSETNWNAPGITPTFTPNLYVDISEHLEAKLRAVACFASQVKEPPDERSLTAIRALAVMRGATVYRHAAEAFAVIRQIA